MTQNTQNELLNSAEYGAGLAFTFMKESAFELQNTLYTEYFGADYSAWHDEMLEIYTDTMRNWVTHLTRRWWDMSM